MKTENLWSCYFYYLFGCLVFNFYQTRKTVICVHLLAKLAIWAICSGCKSTTNHVIICDFGCFSLNIIFTARKRHLFINIMEHVFLRLHQDRFKGENVYMDGKRKSKRKNGACYSILLSEVTKWDVADQTAYYWVPVLHNL